MKKIFSIPLLLVIFFAVSCKKESIPTTSEHNVSSSIEAKSNDSTSRIIINETPFFETCAGWHITNFSFNMADMTSSFQSDALTFCPDNSLRISNDILAVTGNWYSILNKGTPQWLTIHFDETNSSADSRSYPSYWSQIEGTWEIISTQKNMITLVNSAESKQMTIEKVMGL